MIKAAKASLGKKRVSINAVCCTVLMMGVLGLTGCQSLHKSPLGKELDEKDFKVLTTPIPLAPPIPRVKVKSSPSIPEAYKIPVSLYLSKDIPIGTVLEKLGQRLHLDLQVDNALYTPQYGITFSSTGRPFIDVLENICSIAKIRYRISRGMLFIELDLPYSQSYNVQFLNLSRLSENRISSATDIFTHSVAHCSETVGIAPPTATIENGSNTSVTMNSENNFWKELEANLLTLLRPSSEDAATKPSFTIHRQAGIISVFGTSDQHNCVKSYLDVLKKSVSSQILIEAKVIEVSLREEFKSGIDWGRLKVENRIENEVKNIDQNQFHGGINMTGILSDTGGRINPDISRGFSQYTAQLENGLYGFIQALQHFGTTKTLSSPRITVMNNQSAVLKVAKNHVYFKLNYNKHFYTKNNHEDVSVGSDIQTIPIGLVMSVQPAIDPATHSVILFLRPTISRLVGTASDPSVAIAHLNSKEANPQKVPESRIPVVEVKEIDSVLRLKDGEVAVLGGLMETSSTQKRNKTPGLGDIPIVKEMFSSTDKEDCVTEVVILIKVKILDSTAPDFADERLAHLYTEDPRPIC